MPEGIWITTYGNGFYLLNQNKVVKFPLDTDRYLATAHCIIEDKKGFFWITTNHGLFQVAKQQLLDFAAGKIRQVFYLYYDKRNGFATNEFNGGCYPCAVTLADGTISLPSMDGLVWYKPDLIKPELPNRGIFISAIQQDGRNLKVTDTLEIPRDFEQLHLTVSTPYLGDEKNIHMHYSLTGPGRDQHWTSVNPDFIVSIPSLSHGDYQLRIRKASGFTANDYTYKTVQLHVPRAWYETWWFRLLASIAFGGVFFASVRWRSAQHIKKEREANLVRHYRVISQIIAAVNHDIQTPLHYIGFSLKQFNEFVHKLSGIDPLIIRMSDETLGTSQRLNTLTKNILDYIKLQSKSPSERRHMTSVDVSGLVSDVKELFSGIAIHKQVSIINDIDATFNAYTDPSLLSIIIHNLIDNALKVSRSQIRVSSRITSGRKVVCIEDDGGGMPQEQVYWLNKKYRSYQEWLHASQNPGQKGIGLVIVKDLCVLLGIEIGVNVADGRTVILLSFPIS
jgi:signal transduction histidine kinase